MTQHPHQANAPDREGPSILLYPDLRARHDRDPVTRHLATSFGITGSEKHEYSERNTARWMLLANGEVLLQVTVPRLEAGPSSAWLVAKPHDAMSILVETPAGSLQAELTCKRDRNGPYWHCTSVELSDNHAPSRMSRHTALYIARTFVPAMVGLARNIRAAGDGVTTRPRYFVARHHDGHQLLELGDDLELHTFDGAGERYMDVITVPSVISMVCKPDEPAMWMLETSDRVVQAWWMRRMVAGSEPLKPEPARRTSPDERPIRTSSLNREVVLASRFEADGTRMYAPEHIAAIMDRSTAWREHMVRTLLTGDPAPPAPLADRLAAAERVADQAKASHRQTIPPVPYRSAGTRPTQPRRRRNPRTGGVYDQ